MTEQQTRVEVPEADAVAAGRIMYEARWGKTIPWAECGTQRFWIAAGRAVLEAERNGRIGKGQR